jgi:hypothetical protein
MICRSRHLAQRVCEPRRERHQRLYRDFPWAACPAIKKRAGKFAGPAQLERPEVLVPIVVRNIGIFCFPLRQSEEILLGDLTFLCTIAEVRPLLPREVFPLNLRHSLTAENQCPKLVNELILLTRIVVREVRFELSEELSFAALLALQTKAHESRDRPAHTCVGRSSVSSNLFGDSAG